MGGGAFQNKGRSRAWIATPYQPEASARDTSSLADASGWYGKTFVRKSSDVADVPIGLNDQAAPPGLRRIFLDRLEVQFDPQSRRVGNFQVAVLELHRLPHHLAQRPGL